MTEPNAQLMELYGTKVAAAKAAVEGVPTAVQIAAALMGFGLLMGERSRIKGEQAEHAEREELARAIEEERMRPVLESFGKTSSVGLAQGIGRYMAKVAALNSAIEKLASGDVNLTPREYDLAVHHFLSKLAEQGPESLSEMEKEALNIMGVGRSIAGGMKRLLGRGDPQRISQFKPAKMTKAPPPAAGTPSAAGAVGAPPGAAATSEALKQTTQQAGKGGGGGLGWRGKLGLGLGAGVAGYGALKAGQTVSNYMMIPTQQTQQWGFGPRPRPTVSRYGYAY